MYGRALRVPPFSWCGRLFPRWGLATKVTFPTVYNLVRRTCADLVYRVCASCSGLRGLATRVTFWTVYKLVWRACAFVFALHQTLFRIQAYEWPLVVVSWWFHVSSKAHCLSTTFWHEMLIPSFTSLMVSFFLQRGNQTQTKSSFGTARQNFAIPDNSWTCVFCWVAFCVWWCVELAGKVL